MNPKRRDHLNIFTDSIRKGALGDAFPHKVHTASHFITFFRFGMKSLYRIIIARAKGKVKPNTMSYIRGYAIQEKNGQIRSIRILLIFLGVASRERNRILRFFQAAEPAYPFTAALSGKTPLNAYPLR